MKKSVKVIIFIFIMFFSFILSSCGNVEDSDTRVDIKDCEIQILSKAYYTGEEIKLTPATIHVIMPDGYLIYGYSLNLSYKNNIEIGTATLIIDVPEDNKKIKGSTEVDFEILHGAATIVVNTLSEFKDAIASKVYNKVIVNSDFDIAASDSLIINDDKSVTIRSTINNYGTFNVEKGSKVDFYSDSIGGQYFVNEGTFIQTGEVSISGTYKVFLGGSYEINNINVSSSLYANSDISNKVTLSGNGKYITRTLLSSENTKLNMEGTSIRYSDTSRNNLVSVYVDNYLYYGSIKYSDYTKPSDVTVTVSAEATDSKYYGSITLSYTIEKGTFIFRNIADLISAVERNTYDTYISSASDSTLYFDDFTLDSGSILTLNGTAYFNGNFINKGIININNSAYIESAFTNEGEIIGASGKGLYVKNKLINKGNIEYPYNSHFYIYGIFENYGDIYANITLSNGYNIDNYGNLILNYFSNNYNTTSTLNNYNGATLSFKENDVILACIINNEGAITNEVNLCFYGNDYPITSSGTFDNSKGVAYAYDDLSSIIKENFIIRKDINDYNSQIVLESTSIPYDTKVHKPKVSFNNEKSIFITYPSDCTNAGVKEVEVKVNTYYSAYYGTTIVTYEITPIATTVTTCSEFYYKLSSKNYDYITLAANITCGYGPFTIYDFQTVDTNGYSLTVSNSCVTNIYGKLILSPILDKEGIEACALVFKEGERAYTNSTYVQNGGQIINNSTIYIYPDLGYGMSILRNTNGGDIINNGSIYANAIHKSDITTTGNVYFRENLGNLWYCELEFEYSDVDYDGTYHTPSVKVKYDDNYLDMTGLNIEYSDNLNAGNGIITISLKDEMFDKLYSDGATYSFTINRVAYTFNTSPSNELFADTNYNKFIQACDIDLTSDLILTNESTLVLDLANYNITYNDFTITIDEGSKINAMVDTFSEFSEFIYVADLIVFKNDITLDSNFKIEYLESNESANYIGGNKTELTVDLNGYNIYGALKCTSYLDNAILKLINTSDKASSIKSTSSYSLIKEKATNNSSTLNLDVDNLTVYGILITSFVNLEVTNSNIINTEKNNAISLDTNDYCRGVVATFDNCNITAETNAIRMNYGHVTITNSTVTSTNVSVAIVVMQNVYTSDTISLIIESTQFDSNSVYITMKNTLKTPRIIYISLNATNAILNDLNL